MKSLNSQVTTALAGNSIQDTTKAIPARESDGDTEPTNIASSKKKRPGVHLTPQRADLDN